MFFSLYIDNLFFFIFICLFPIPSSINKFIKESIFCVLKAWKFFVKKTWKFNHLVVDYGDPIEEDVSIFFDFKTFKISNIVFSRGNVLYFI
ncbi:hypothetical protein MtrunA17_Chr3g0099391 [Medicago truncatula]|uniref:Transmembrane protein n=1 Tax=Medicago truncatula TaxID=3880 RepID=A0A396IR41_MEDTR|nr:hypothetical protein MtrunA17_Chr3g0099391 [Medicago truncatula]